MKDRLHGYPVRERGVNYQCEMAPSEMLDSYMKGWQKSVKINAAMQPGSTQNQYQ